MRDTENILNFWQAHNDEDLVLATIVRKHFSGYRAVGAKKIISKESDCGILSGGCLEADINNIAKQTWHQLPLLKTFSTLDNSSVFGYQTGCIGAIEVLFEKLPARTEHKNLYIPYGKRRLSEGVEIGIREFNLGYRRFVSTPSINDDLFYDPWVEPVTLCVIGCGPDAPTLFEIVTTMGWQILALDYRPDYSVTSPIVNICPLKDITSYIPEGERVAVILMTHNYEADLQILNELNGKHLGYLGCLGPRKRFEQMKTDLLIKFGSILSPEFESIIHAPVGLFSNGCCPEEIALSIASEIQSILRNCSSTQLCPI